MSFCYTLKVHSFPFTMSLKLSLCALCQECHDCLRLQNYHKLLSSKCWEMPLKVGYIFSLTAPLLLNASAMFYVPLL